MIDKKKFIKFNRITIVLVLIFILLILGRTFSSFQTDGKGKANLDIAFYVLDTKTQSEDIKMFEIAPDGQDYVYSINVSNFKNNKTSEVDLEYELTLVTTTNLPVKYEIYLSDSTDNIITSKEIYQDEDGMYFYKFHTPKKNFTHDVKQTDNYKLVVNFPEQYKSSEYQDLLESATIYIDSKQM